MRRRHNSSSFTEEQHRVYFRPIGLYNNFLLLFHQILVPTSFHFDIINKSNCSVNVCVPCVRCGAFFSRKYSVSTTDCILVVRETIRETMRAWPFNTLMHSALRLDVCIVLKRCNSVLLCKTANHWTTKTNIEKEREKKVFFFSETTRPILMISKSTWNRCHFRKRLRVSERVSERHIAQCTSIVCIYIFAFGMGKSVNMR